MILRNLNTRSRMFSFQVSPVDFDDDSKFGYVRSMVRHAKRPALFSEKYIRMPALTQFYGYWEAVGLGKD